MLLAELSGTCACSSASLSARLTRAWQSSNEPATRSAETLSPKQPSWCAWRGETRPSGYSTTTRSPGWPWNAAATAAPVSPEVATRMVSGRSAPRRMRARQAARKRAPMSLNAAVGPWNSSSTWSFGVASGSSGTGKSKASAQIAGSSASSASPAKNGASSPLVVSARVAPARSWRGAGSACGTYRPPSGARPAAMAWLRFTAGAALRVEMKFIVDPSERGATAGRPSVIVMPGCAVGPRPGRRLQQRGAGAVQRRDPGLALQSCSGERGLHRRRGGLGAGAVLEPAEHAGAGAGDARAHRPAVQPRRLGRGETRDERGAARLDQHVAQAGTYQAGIAGMATGQHQGQVRALGDELGQFVAAGQGLARLARLQHGLRMHQQAVPFLRHRDPHQPV